MNQIPPLEYVPLNSPATLNNLIIVLCTCPDQATAQSLAKGLLEQKLAACINIIPGIQSLYYWQDLLTESTEHLLVAKTLNQAYSKLEDYLKNHHPYECPEILSLPIIQGWTGYLDWVTSNVNP